ncbi:MAG: adenine deaminase C-terminal domain-containing protein [Chitinophagaceae bacterium]
MAHDSHNIIVVGTNNELICRAVNSLIENKGGICAIHEKDEKVLSLPVIPHLKLSDKGLFDGDNFTFTSVTIPKLTCILVKFFSIFVLLLF